MFGPKDRTNFCIQRAIWQTGDFIECIMDYDRNICPKKNHFFHQKFSMLERYSYEKKKLQTSAKAARKPHFSFSLLSAFFFISLHYLLVHYLPICDLHHTDPLYIIYLLCAQDAILMTNTVKNWYDNEWKWALN